MNLTYSYFVCTDAVMKFVRSVYEDRILSVSWILIRPKQPHTCYAEYGFEAAKKPIYGGVE